MNSSLFTEIFAESLPQLVIVLVNEFVIKNDEVGSITFWFAFTTSLYSFLSASYPIVHHMCEKRSFVEGLKAPRYKNKHLVIHPLFEGGHNSQLFNCKCKKKNNKNNEVGSKITPT